MQFKHINLCANDINEEVKGPLIAVLRRTTDSFGVTLAGNPIARSTIDAINKEILEHHIHKVGGLEHADPQIALKRL